MCLNDYFLASTEPIDLWILIDAWIGHRARYDLIVDIEFFWSQ